MKKMFLTLTLTIALLISGANEGFATSPTYKVKKGDTLYKISQKHNTTVAKLKSLNKLKSDIIFPNQKLNVVSNEKKSKKSAAQQKSRLQKLYHGQCLRTLLKNLLSRQQHIQRIATVVLV